MKTKMLSAALAAIVLFMSSCATILSGSSQKVTFKSNVNGRVYQNLKEIGGTNEEIKVKRSDIPKLYTIKTDGCPDKQFELPIKTTGTYWINLPFAFVLVGVFTGYIDAANGNNMRTDKTINVNVDCKTK